MRQETQRKVTYILAEYEKLPLRLQERINIHFFRMADYYLIEDDYIRDRVNEAYDFINEFLTYEA